MPAQKSRGARPFGNRAPRFSWACYTGKLTALRSEAIERLPGANAQSDTKDLATTHAQKQEPHDSTRVSSNDDPNASDGRDWRDASRIATRPGSARPDGRQRSNSGGRDWGRGPRDPAPAATA